ncbi:hypothetical protein [Treponema socranskii]|uniref:hypothetical protein n=1 Tax=Treponema socranskii TaxID=53419 RepID=UPI003D8CF346
MRDIQFRFAEVDGTVFGKLFDRRSSKLTPPFFMSTLYVRLLRKTSVVFGKRP